MKRPTVIITDPNKIREICLNQPKVSRAEAVRSILEQNSKLPSQPTQQSEKHQEPLDFSQYGCVTLLMPPGGLKNAPEPEFPISPEDLTEALRLLHLRAGRI